MANQRQKASTRIKRPPPSVDRSSLKSVVKQGENKPLQPNEQTPANSREDSK